MKVFSPNFDKFAIDRLRIELFNKIGWNISTKSDCLAFSELISKSGLGFLSESTIYRLFFQFGKHSSYKNTLDILCKFIGYKDSIQFLEKLEDSRQELHYHGLNTIAYNRNSLIFWCIENTVKNPLVDYFEAVNETSHQFKIDLSISIFDSLLISTRGNWFFKYFSNQTYIREYFFEKGHDTKFRIKNYDKAYLNYLNGINPDKDIRHLQDYIFGNCVLFRHYFIGGELNRAKKLGKRLYFVDLEFDHVLHEIYIFPHIRFRAYKLFYLALTNASTSIITEYALFLLDYCSQIKINLNYMEQKIVFHTVAESFIYTSVPIDFHEKLKEIFNHLYKPIPSSIRQKHLKYSLPYFDENGLLHYRP